MVTISIKVEAILKELSQNGLQFVMEMWYHCMVKCLELSIDYMEK